MHPLQSKLSESLWNKRRKTVRTDKKDREAVKYESLDEALKIKNDRAREYLKNVKWP